MYIFILIVHIIASFILVAVILLQAGRGGDVAQAFGGGSSSTTIFGQKTSVFLTRATTVSAVLFLCTSLSLAVISSRRTRSLMEKIKIPAPVAEQKTTPITEPEKETARQTEEVPK
jgi:preprotein translocase subunit SecG